MTVAALSDGQANLLAEILESVGLSPSQAQQIIRRFDERSNTDEQTP